MSDGMRRELAYLSSHATNRYFIPNWGNSVWIYRITDRDAYSETVLIHSNVDNGWGIVGALATERHTIRF